MPARLFACTFATHLLQLTIFMFQKRGTARTMPTNGKKEVVKTILECLKSNLESQNMVSELKDVTIINKINDLIEEAEKWGKLSTIKIKDLSTIADKVAKHSVEFDITGKALKREVEPNSWWY